MNVMIDDKWSDVCQMSDLITLCARYRSSCLTQVNSTRDLQNFQSYPSAFPCFFIIMKHV